MKFGPSTTGDDLADRLEAMAESLDLGSDDYDALTEAAERVLESYQGDE